MGNKSLKIRDECQLWALIAATTIAVVIHYQQAQCFHKHVNKTFWKSYICIYHVFITVYGVNSEQLGIYGHPESILKVSAGSKILIN